MRKAACILVLATAGATLATTTVPAMAEERHRITVEYADLNLATSLGRSKLDSRIAGAARAICGSAVATSPMMKARIKVCRADVISRANAALAAKLNSSSGARAAR